jgi:hypothetical protein
MKDLILTVITLACIINVTMFIIILSLPVVAILYFKRRHSLVLFIDTLMDKLL